MVSAEKPHYLLFSAIEAQESARPDSGGRWRFQLEALDGSATFGAADDEPDMDRQRLELLAVVRGLEALDHPSQVTLLTPSRYVSRGIRFGLGSWRESNWCWESFGRMATVRNADLWQRIDAALEIHQVRCKSVPFGAAGFESSASSRAANRSPRFAPKWALLSPRPAWLARFRYCWQSLLRLKSQRTTLCPQ